MMMRKTLRRRGDRMMRRRAEKGMTTRNDTLRNRKVGDITTTAEKEELGHNNEGHGPSTYTRTTDYITCNT